MCERQGEEEGEEGVVPLSPSRATVWCSVRSTPQSAAGTAALTDVINWSKLHRKPAAKMN